MAPDWGRGSLPQDDRISPPISDCSTNRAVRPLGNSTSANRVFTDLVHWEEKGDRRRGRHQCGRTKVAGGSPGWDGRTRRKPAEAGLHLMRRQFHRGGSAPDWTRTSTPIRAQALNLLCIPIPPRGLFHTIILIFAPLVKPRSPPLPDEFGQRRSGKAEKIRTFRSFRFSADRTLSARGACILAATWATRSRGSARPRPTPSPNPPGDPRSAALPSLP